MTGNTPPTPPKTNNKNTKHYCVRSHNKFPFSLGEALQIFAFFKCFQILPYYGINSSKPESAISALNTTFKLVAAVCSLSSKCT